MSINCSIIRDPEDPSKILFTEAPNGARSMLFDGLKAETWNQDRALDLWLTSKTTTFRESVSTPKLNRHRVQLMSKVGDITPNVDTINVVNDETGDIVTLDLTDMSFRAEPTPGVKPMVAPRAPVLSIEEQKKLVKLEKDNEGNILAPNGEISNLKEDHARLVRTPAFKQWFGDWQKNPQDSSQVVDENGEPKVFLHGSPVPNIDSFDRSKSGKYGSRLKEFGTYFTDNTKVAEVYSRTARSNELEEDIQQKIYKLEKALLEVRNSKDYESIRSEIDKLQGGRIYEVFLNVKPEEVHQFDGQGLAGVRAYDQLQVDAGYKIATNRDAMEFLKDGRFGVPQKKAINATNIAEVDGAWFQNLSPYEQMEVMGETYLVLDGNEDAIRMATDTEFGLAQQQVTPVGPVTAYTLNAYAHPVEKGMGVNVGRIRYVVRGNEMMVDNSTLRALTLEEGAPVQNAGEIMIDVEGIRMQDRAGSKVGKGLSISAKGMDEVELTEDYVAKTLPEKYIQHANILRQYPQVRGVKYIKPITTVKQARAVHKIFVEQAKQNLLWLADQYKAEFKDPASVWYDGANKMANDMATKYGKSPEQVAGIIAALSPQNDWYQNVRAAELVMEAYRENPILDDSMFAAFEAFTKRSADQQKGAKRTAIIEKTNKDREYLEKFRGQRLSEMPQPAQARAIRMYEERLGDKSYNILTPDGKVVEVARNNDGTTTDFAWGSYGEIGKAVAIYNDGSAQNISRRLGHAHKIRNFYNNIIDPNSKDGDVTIDTHAVAAAMLEPVGGSSELVAQNFGGKGSVISKAAGVSGLYYAYQEAYKQAADELGLLPRQVQSITWEAARGLFPDRDKQRLKPKVNAIWDQYKSGKITLDGARKRILEATDGINDPSWARFAVPVYDGQGRQAADQEGISQGARADLGEAAGFGATGNGGAAVRPSLAGKGIGSTMYAALFKEAMKEGYNVVSSDNLSPDAKRMWNKLVEKGIAKDLGDRFMLDMYPPGFDNNGEPSPQVVMDFTDRAAYEQELTPEEENELYDIMTGLPVNSSEDLLASLKNAFMPEGRFKPTRDSLMYSGLYNSDNISDIMTNEALQEQIREFIYKLEKLDKVYLNDMYTDELYSVVEDGSRTPIGTFKLMNPFQVEQQVIQKLGGFAERADFEEALYTDDIQEMIGSAYEAFKNTGKDIFFQMRKFKPTSEVIIEDGQLVPRTTGVKETLRKVMMVPQSRQLEIDTDLLISTDEEVWYTTPKSVDTLLQNTENRLRALGMDIEGLVSMSKVNGVEATKDFLGAVLDYSLNPTDNTVDALADAYQEFMEIKDRFAYTKKDVGTDTNPGNLFSLTTEQHSAQLFADHNMIPIRKGVYKRVDVIGVDAMLNVLYDHLMSTQGYGGVLPEAALKPAAADENGQLNMAKVQDPNNRNAIINSMRAWVQSEVGKLYTENVNATPEQLQAYILMFHYYNKSDNYDQFETVPPQSEEFRLLSQPIDNVDYLVNTFPGELNVRALSEKKKNSKLWKNVYSNLVFNSNGIELKSEDPISLNRMKPYLEDELFDVVRYFRLFKGKPELMPETIEEPIIDDLFRRNYYTNYPTALKPFRGEYTVLQGNTITASSKAPFLRTPSGIYEMVEAIGRFGVYVKHQTNNGPLKRYDPNMAPPKMNANRDKLKNISASVQSVTEIKNLFDFDEGNDIDQKFDNC